MLVFLDLVQALSSQQLAGLGDVYAERFRKQHIPQFWGRYDKRRRNVQRTLRIEGPGLGGRVQSGCRVDAAGDSMLNELYGSDVHDFCTTAVWLLRDW